MGLFGPSELVSDLLLVVLLQRDLLLLDLLSDGCSILAWLVHFSALMVLQRTSREPEDLHCCSCWSFSPSQTWSSP
ncbi:Syntaxin-binding protein 5 [Dissostichus eleginoides]|uniref:Syntaxin-binding protein 5 n=1 Tax=Dissostichus eleginoides TaxID=100907 RepID=A0AAD9BN73_DISEL|nr:Syntaxin-binding protein 5 [Dissostichus eleginoides]